MNRDALRHALPDGQAWAALTSTAKKELVEAHLAALLDAIAQDGREPDHWEATDTGAALNALLMGWYTLAVNYAAHALCPPEERAQAWPRKDETPTVRDLRLALEYVKGAPARG